MKDTIINKLSGNYDMLYDIINNLDFYNIRRSGSNIHFAFDNVGGSGSCVLNIDSLIFKRFSTGDGGNIFNVVMLKKQCSFYQSITYLKGILKLEGKVEFEESKLFGGVFSNNDIEDKIYTEDELNKYPISICKRLLDDNISKVSQVYFDVMYNPFDERILFPYKNLNGDIVGWNGRANYEAKDRYYKKYMTSLGFVKGNNLFGIYQNQDYIKNSFVVIVESEKSVLQAHTFGFRNIVAIGSSSISFKQAEILIEEFKCKSLIFMLDEGSDFLAYENNFDKLFKMFNFEAWYLHDYNLFELGGKQSPTDLGEEKFNHILKNCIKFYN